MTTATQARDLLGGIYARAGRITYGNFCEAAEETLVSLVASARPQWRGAIFPQVRTNGGKTAAINVQEAETPDALGGRKCLLLRVAMPSYPLETVLSPAYAVRLLGFLFHEALHAIWSLPSNVWRFEIEAAALRLGQDPQALQTLWNRLEDHGIEYHATNPAAPLTGNAAGLLGNLNAVLSEGQDGAAAVAAAVAAQNGNALMQANALLWTQINRHGQQAAPDLFAAAPAAMAAAAPDVADAVRDALGRIEATAPDACHDRIAIAADLMRALMDAQEKQDQQQKPEDGDGQQDQQQQDQQPEDGNGQQDQQPEDQQPEDQQPEDGKGDGETGGEGEDGDDDADQPEDGEGDADGEGEGEDQPEDGKAGGAGEGDADGGGEDQQPEDAAAGAGAGKPEVRDPDAARADALAAAAPDVAPEDMNAARRTETGKAKVAQDAAYWFKNTHQRSGSKERAEVARQVCAALDARALGEAFRQGLKSVETITQARRLQSGRMDRRAMVRAQLGALDVFTRRTVTEGLTTDVLVMLDGSGSMRIGETVQTRGGDLFPTRWGASVGALARIIPAIERAGAGCAAYAFASAVEPDGATLFELKPWRQRAAAASARFLSDAFAAFDPDGGTPMEREARWATAQMLARPVKRRVVLWLCDGAPDNRAPTREELARGRAAGVEHVGIALAGGDGVTDLFGGHARAVTNLADLPSVMLELLDPVKAARRLTGAA